MKNNEYIEDIYRPEIIELIWQKAIIVEGYDATLYRQDFSGAWISRNAYKNRHSVLGWEIDHVFPKSKGGDNQLINLRPINWRNNIAKGDDYPYYVSAVVAQDNSNVEKEVKCIVSVKLQEELSKIYNIKQ